MKKRINLFDQRSRQFSIIQREDFWLKIFLSFFFVFLLLILAEFVGYYFLNAKRMALARRQTIVKSYINSNAVLGAKIEKFIYKSNLLKKYLKEDAHTNTYFEKLNSVMQNMSQKSTITSFKIDNQQIASFRLSFDSETSALAFISELENSQPYDIFKYLKLNSLSVSLDEVEQKAPDSSSSKTFHLEFITEFNKINET